MRQVAARLLRATKRGALEAPPKLVRLLEAASRAVPYTNPSFSVRFGGMRAIGYVRVSTEEQGRSGLGLESQRRAIRQAAKERGWKLVAICEDPGVSGKAMKGRKGLSEALTAVESEKAGVLLVAKLDRLSRSLLDFAMLMEQSRRKKWSLVALDLGVDTTTPAGEALASTLAVFAQFERRLIGERTKNALAVKRSQGVTLGRPRSLPEEVRNRIEQMHSSGASLSAIARELTEEGVPTAHGGKRWYPSTVKSMLRAANR